MLSLRCVSFKSVFQIKFLQQLFLFRNRNRNLAPAILIVFLSISLLLNSPILSALLSKGWVKFCFNIDRTFRSPLSFCSTASNALFAEKKIIRAGISLYHFPSIVSCSFQAHHKAAGMSWAWYYRLLPSSWKPAFISFQFCRSQSGRAYLLPSSCGGVQQIRPPSPNS